MERGSKGKGLVLLSMMLTAQFIHFFIPRRWVGHTGAKLAGAGGQLHPTITAVAGIGKHSISNGFGNGWIQAFFKCKLGYEKSDSHFFLVQAASLTEDRILHHLYLSRTIKITSPIFCSWMLDVV